MADPGLNYKVTVSGAAQGAAEVGKLADATGKVATETSKAAPKAKGLADALASLGGRNNPAKDVLEGISAAARGGEGSVFGLTKAFKGLKELVSGGFAALGPGGILVAGLGVVIGLLPKFFELVRGGAKDVETLEERIKKATEATDALGKAQLNQLKSQFNDIEEAASKARKEFDKDLAALERLDNARKASALAQNRARTDISQEKKDANEIAINKTFTERERARKIAPFQRDVSDAENAVANASDFAREAETNFRRKEIELAKLLKQQAARDTLQAQVSSVTSFGDVNEAGRRAKLQGKLNQLPEVDPEKIAVLQTEAGNLGEIAKTALKNLSNAQKQLEEASGDFQREKQVQKFEDKSEDRQKITARITDIRDRRNAAGRRAEEASAAGNDSAQDEAVAEFRKLSAELAKAKLDLGPIKDSTAEVSAKIGDFSTGLQQNVASAADSLKQAGAAMPQPPSLDPLVSAVKEGFSNVSTRLDKMQREINENARDIKRVAEQMKNSRTNATQ